MLVKYCKYHQEQIFIATKDSGGNFKYSFSGGKYIIPMIPVCSNSVFIRKCNFNVSLWNTLDIDVSFMFISTSAMMTVYFSFITLYLHNNGFQGNKIIAIKSLILLSVIYSVWCCSSIIELKCPCFDVFLPSTNIIVLDR